MSVSVWRDCFSHNRKLELLYMSFAEPEIWPRHDPAEKVGGSDVLMYQTAYMSTYMVEFQKPWRSSRMARCWPEVRETHCMFEFKKSRARFTCVCVAV
jgi:hypothetical protein